MTADVGEQATDAELADGFRRHPDRFTAVHDWFFRDIYRYAAGRLDAQSVAPCTSQSRPVTALSPPGSRSHLPG